MRSGISRSTRGGWWLALVLAACATAPPQGPMEGALEAVHGGGGSPRERALAAWYDLLVSGRPGDADKGFAAGGSDAVALAGQLALAQRASLIERRAELAVDLARADPQGVLGRIGAHAMADLVGASPHLDEVLASGAQQLLSQPGLSSSIAFLCRLTLARVALTHSSKGWEDRFREMGALTEAALVGPFGALRELDFPRAYPPEMEQSLRPEYATPVGKVLTRTLRYPSGEIRFSGEPERGDIFFLASDFTSRGGTYVLNLATTSPHAVIIDGQVVSFRPPSSMASAVEAASIALGPGPHRMTVKVTRAEGGGFSAFLSRDDGAAEDLHFRAASGPAPASPHGAEGDGGAGTAEGPPMAVASVPMDARAVYESLLPEVGRLVAAYLSAWDSLGRDFDGGKGVLAAVAPPDAKLSALSPTELVLRAHYAVADRTLPDRIAKAQAGRDLEEATLRDPGNLEAWLMRANEARDEDRLDDAQGLLAHARQAGLSALVDVAEARLDLARGLDPLARTAALHANDKVQGLCEATLIRYDLARRNDAVGESNRLIRELATCPEGLDRAQEHAKTRGDLPAAERVARQRLARAPFNWRQAAELADLLVAQRRYPDALAVLADQVALWPRLAELHKRMASVHALQGDAAGELAEKRLAIALDGGDLLLRRQVALAEGKDLLSDLAVDGAKAIADYEKAAQPTAAAATAYVLDMAGIEAYPDGSQVERIHTIAKVLDQRGIPMLAEQRIPQGSVVLKLQTVKRDGRVLEPEAIVDKEGSVSLPSVEVGDYVEVEYLSTTPPRGPAEPGFATVPFFFRIVDSPLFFSTLTIRAPSDAAIQVDAHNMEPPAPEKQGNAWVVHHEAHQVPLRLPEPGAPSGTEYLPFLQVGTGAGVLDGLLPFSDAIVGHDAPTVEVVRFARAAAGDRTGIDAVKAVYAAVMDKVKGEENDIHERAASTLARERGSRLWLLKGALRALGISSRLALVRPLSADPARYTFPDTELYVYPVLVVRVPTAPSAEGGSAGSARPETLWLDPSARYAPFGELPDTVAGGHEAAVLPEPGEGIELASTPAASPLTPKQVKLHLALNADGDVTGEGSELYQGFDAAWLRQALDRLDDSQRKQAIEVALSRTFRGAALDALQMKGDPAVGAPLTLSYSFHSPRFGRAEGDRMVLSTAIFPMGLGQRYVSTATRELPLLVGNTESANSEFTIDLPPGYQLQSAGQPSTISTRFGTYARTSNLVKGHLVIEESAVLRAGRIPPEQYPEFVRFAASVDQAQTQDIDLARAP